MKSIAVLLSLSVLMFFTSCKKCNNEDPTAKVVNNGTSAVSLQITSASGDIISITDLKNGSISSEKSYAPGEATINGTIEGIQLNETVNMNECSSYDITINSENKIVVFSYKKE